MRNDWIDGGELLKRWGINSLNLKDMICRENLKTYDTLESTWYPTCLRGITNKYIPRKLREYLDRLSNQRIERQMHELKRYRFLLKDIEEYEQKNPDIKIVPVNLIVDHSEQRSKPQGRPARVNETILLDLVREFQNHKNKPNISNEQILTKHAHKHDIDPTAARKFITSNKRFLPNESQSRKPSELTEEDIVALFNNKNALKSRTQSAS